MCVYMCVCVFVCMCVCMCVCKTLRLLTFLQDTFSKKHFWGWALREFYGESSSRFNSCLRRHVAELCLDLLLYSNGNNEDAGETDKYDDDFFD